MKRNPAKSGKQYRLAQAVAHGTVRKKTRMSKKAAREIIRKTPKAKRSQFARGNPSDAYKAGVAAMRAAAARHGTTNLTPSIQQREDWRHDWAQFMAGWNAEKKRKNPGHRRRNPEVSAAAAYRDFHGKEPETIIETSTPIRYHGVLAGIGKLRYIDVKSPIGITRITFGKGTFLTENEKRTQLYISGGDQSVNLKDFGIKTPHETELLGQALSVCYHTEKKHLRPEDGGKGDYVHKFGRVKPSLIYDVRNKLLSFAGGGYSIPSEGIDG